MGTIFQSILLRTAERSTAEESVSVTDESRIYWRARSNSLFVVRACVPFRFGSACMEVVSPFSLGASLTSDTLKSSVTHQSLQEREVVKSRASRKRTKRVPNHCREGDLLLCSWDVSLSHIHYSYKYTYTRSLFIRSPSVC